MASGDFYESKGHFELPKQTEQMDKSAEREKEQRSMLDALEAMKKAMEEQKTKDSGHCPYCDPVPRCPHCGRPMLNRPYYFGPIPGLNCLG